MTILGVPEGTGFATSSSIAPVNNGGSNVDMSLDDMIKNRRRSSRLKKDDNKMTSPSSVDRAVGRGRANRQAKLNARRGLRQDTKASPMEIEKEVYKEARKSANMKAADNKANGGGGLRAGRNRRQVDVKTKSKQEKKKMKQQEKKEEVHDNVPPTWIGGTRRPPSKKAISAAVTAMTNSGFKVPRGMQMVISFAPAPSEDPTKKLSEANKNAPKKRGKGNNRSKGGGGGRK